METLVISLETNIVVLVLSGLLLGGMALADQTRPPSGQPAVWVPHNVIVDLHDLPKPYSCDELWYKFHDVLLAIGARPNMRILAYRCENAPGVPARSPRVELQFELPEVVKAAQARWADVSVVSSTVRIGPGEPPSIDSHDCVLLRQIKSSLLDALPVKVVAFNLACAAPQHRGPRFGISAQALTPVETGEKRVAFRNADTAGNGDATAQGGQ